MRASWITLIVLVFFASAGAKELTHRLGVGYKNQFSTDMPAIAAQYYPNQDLGVSAALGIDTAENASKFGFGVKIYRIIFKEQNMNFYMGGGVGLISVERADPNNAGKFKNSSGFELNGMAGGEFFFNGLESLGFTFETGISVTSINDGVHFTSFGHSPVKGGVIFYF